MAQVVCLTGSVVRGCFIARAVDVVGRRLGDHGFDVDCMLAADLDLPLFGFEYEETKGVPPAANDLYRRLRQASGLVIGVPEINASMTSVLKNTLDWLWRAGAGSDSAFTGLATVIVSGSKHFHAGIRAAEHARSTLASLGCVVLPEQGALPFAQRHFDPGPDGEISDAVLLGQLTQLADSLAAMASLGRAPVAGRSPWLDSLQPTEITD